jgi:hypothetical protein
MKKTYYVKEGKRYVPVAEYDSDLSDSFPSGAHLVMCYPGGKLRKFNIDPNHAALIAASKTAHDRMINAVLEASKLRPTKTALTLEQGLAWKNLAQALGQDSCTLQTNNATDIAQAGINALIEEADKLMQNDAVREAYNQFLLVCELTKKH